MRIFHTCFINFTLSREKGFILFDSLPSSNFKKLNNDIFLFMNKILIFEQLEPYVYSISVLNCIEFFMSDNESEFNFSFESREEDRQILRFSIWF